jgi:hypothetical protein
LRWLITVGLLLASFTASAEGRVYGELQLGAGGVSHSELDFFPSFGTVSLGAYVAPNIGLEVFADTSIAPGEDDDFQLDIEQAVGVGLRLQSPPVDNVQGFIVLGAVNFTLDQTLTNAAASQVNDVNEEFTGLRVSVGLMQRLQRVPNTLVTAEYRHYNADGPLRLDAIVLGLRINTP